MMRRVWLALAVVVLLATGHAAYAVDLQAGWYAWFGGVYLQGFDPNTGGSYSAAWYPSSTLGQFDYMTVSEWEGYPSTRKVAVSADASVAPGVLFEDIGSYSSANRIYPLVYASWETNYDANKMRLQLFRRRTGQADELVWQQTASGHQIASVGSGSIWSASPVLPDDELIFRVVAVPEPTGILTLVCGSSAIFWRLRRRSR